MYTPTVYCHRNGLFRPVKRPVLRGKSPTQKRIKSRITHTLESRTQNYGTADANFNGNCHMDHTTVPSPSPPPTTPPHPPRASILSSCEFLFWPCLSGLYGENSVLSNELEPRLLGISYYGHRAGVFCFDKINIAESLDG